MVMQQLQNQFVKSISMLQLHAFKKKPRAIAEGSFAFFYRIGKF
jgi:hypothetical protein